MHSEVYFTITLAALYSIWLVWDLGIRKLLLDSFRERLFVLRFRLFEMGESGELPFESEAYRAIETLLCGLLRYGHRLTFVGLIVSARNQEHAKRNREHVDYTQQIDLKIARTDPAAQVKLRTLLGDIHDAVLVYVSISSLLFMIAAAILLVLRSFNLCKAYTKRKVSSVLESEVYGAEASRHRFGDMATA